MNKIKLKKVKIRERLEKMGKSQGWLSRKTGLTRQHIYRITNNKLSHPYAETTAIISRALNCLIEDIFIFENKNETPNN